MIPNITAPQQLVVDFLATREGHSAERHILSLKKLDVRAANNLVKQGIVTCENGIYTLVEVIAEQDEAMGEAEQIPLTESRVEPTEGFTAAKEVVAVVEAAIKPLKKAKAPKEPKAPKSVKEPIAPHPCLCGCGATLTNKSLFAQGHDAKLHSRILKEHRAAPTGPVPVTQAQYDFLGTAHWMKPEILAALVVA